MKFVKTAQKLFPPIPSLIELKSDLSDEALASLETKLVMGSKGHLKPILASIESTTGIEPYSTADLEAHWAANDLANGVSTGADYASASDMSALSVIKPIPDDGEPGQVLAVDEDGKPEWITLPLDFASPPPPKSPVVAALDAMSDAGVHVGHIDVSQTYHPGELPQINLTMTLHTMPKNMGDLIAEVHAWAAKKGGTLA